MNVKQDPWFKNIYVWLVIALPMSAVLGGIATIIITSQNQPDMVVDDYYKKGKAINQELKLYQQAQAQGITLDVLISEQNIVIDNSAHFPALKINLVHSTQKYRDLTLIATPNAKNQLTAPLDTQLTGKWQIFVAPMDESWKLRAELGLPNTEVITLK